MPKAVDSPITKLLKLAAMLTPEERQAGIDILRHYGRPATPKPTAPKKTRQKATQTAGEATS